MNIFYFTNNIILNSKLLDDKRLVKMVTETAQLLSNCLYLHGKISPYKPTHLKHPCTIWASESQGNWEWLKSYGLALAREYTRRYGKIHKCENIIKNMQCPQIKNKKFCQPRQCMPNKYKCNKTSTAYINYYIWEKFNPVYFKHCHQKVFNFWSKLYRNSRFKLYCRQKNSYNLVTKKLKQYNKYL